MKQSLAAETAKAISPKSYWVSPSQNTVFSIELTSPFAVPNYGMPYQLIVSAYSPTPMFYAQSFGYHGGIDINGDINFINAVEQSVGRLLGTNQIIWEDGRVWIRTSVPANRGVNPRAPEVVLDQAARFSEIFNDRYEAAYPNIYRVQRF